MLEDAVQDESMLLFKFTYGGDVMDQSRDGFFSGRFTIFAIHPGNYSFPDLELLDVRIALSLNKIIQNSYLKKKVSLEEQKAQKSRPNPSLKTDRLLDLRLLLGHLRQRFYARLCRPILYCSSE